MRYFLQQIMKYALLLKSEMSRIEDYVPMQCAWSHYTITTGTINMSDSVNMTKRCEPQ